MRLIPLGARIAARYLYGRKSYSAVNAIALVSVCGIAIATAAIVCVLSVFNGFQEVLGNKLDNLSPDIELTPKEGKSFGESDQLTARLSRLPQVKIAQPILKEQALALFGSRELPITLIGVEAGPYRRGTRLDSLLFEGGEPLKKPTYAEQAAPASVAVGTAMQLQLGGYGQRVMIFAPRRNGRINPANPGASFQTDSIEVTSIFQSGQKEYDDNVVVTDIDRVRELLQHPADQAGAIHITLREGADSEEALRAVEAAAGPGFEIKDRMRQHEVNFRMVQIEKYITFLLLVFILVIASFNVISTLCMLVLEKEESIHTLNALGMTRRRIGNVFAWESWLVTLSGAAAGIAIGSVLCLLQERYGFIKLNGDAESLILSSYPVKLVWKDLLLTLAPIVAIGIFCALTAARYARAKANPRP